VRDGEEEAAAFAGCALDPDASAVRLDNAFADGLAEVPSAAPALSSADTIEYPCGRGMSTGIGAGGRAHHRFVGTLQPLWRHNHVALCISGCHVVIYDLFWHEVSPFFGSWLHPCAERPWTHRSLTRRERHIHLSDIRAIAIVSYASSLGNQRRFVSDLTRFGMRLALSEISWVRPSGLPNRGPSNRVASRVKTQEADKASALHRLSRDGAGLRGRTLTTSGAIGIRSDSHPGAEVERELVESPPPPAS
jgi:hypothetical protein